MKSFLKMFGASILGTLVALLIGFFIISRIVGNLTKEAKIKVKANTVLTIDLAEPVTELAGNEQTSPFEFEAQQKLGLNDMVNAIKQAAEDDKIKGIYIENTDAALGFSGMSVVRDALLEFRESGKFVIWYADYYSQKAWYMATAADAVYLNPMGVVDFRGLGTEVQYLKGMFDKLGIKTQVFYAGKFKSASEPFRRTDMSEANRKQLHVLLDDLYEQMLTEISASRGIAVNELKNIANNMLSRNADAALRLKMVDAIYYKDQVIDAMKDKIGLDYSEDIPSLSIGEYAEARGKKKNYKVKEKIAVVYAEGMILDGEAQEGMIGGDKYAKIIRKLRRNDKVKAIVLRINSGGGSALASDIMWREIEMAIQDGKTVVTSMGDVAASGGYYMAANSEVIFAEANTITGSIGVFGMIPNVRKFTNEVMGVTIDTVRTGKFASMNPLYYEMNEEERAFVQEGIDSTYLRFKTVVAEGRDISLDSVEAVAQGRVWTGRKAKEIGLVDEIGGLNDAIAKAAELSGLSEYRTDEYPKIEEPFARFMKQLSGQAAVKAALGKDFDLFTEYFEALQFVKQVRGPQMRMPFKLNIQ